jgi:hypothetical protein
MELEEENRQALHLVQSMLGMVTPNLRGASIVVGPDIELHFVLEQDSDIDREEIEDAEFEFTAYQSHPVSVKTVVLVSKEPWTAEMLPGRKVYMRRE